MNVISKHSFSLAQYVYKNLATLHHSNGKPVVIFYHDSTFDDINLQGSTVNFNLLRDNGEYVGNTEVSKCKITHAYRMYKSLTVFQPWKSWYYLHFDSVNNLLHSFRSSISFPQKNANHTLFSGLTSRLFSFSEGPLALAENQSWTTNLTLKCLSILNSQCMWKFFPSTSTWKSSCWHYCFGEFNIYNKIGRNSQWQSLLPSITSLQYYQPFRPLAHILP